MQFSDFLFGFLLRRAFTKHCCCFQITLSGQIRLADLGIATPEKNITGTLAGTPLYMAPEIFSPGRYNRSADMFSFGLILWELWYGRNVSKVYTINNLRHLPRLAFLNDGRPDENSPWRKTMLDCWSDVPGNRPSAATCCQIFADCKKQQTDLRLEEMLHNARGHAA